MPAQDPLDLGDIKRLVELTDTRARAEQRSAECLARILALLERQDETLHRLASKVTHMEGLSVAMAAFIARRNGEDLERLRAILDDAERDPAVSIHVEQKSGDLNIESDRDAFVAGGNIEKE